MKKKLLKVFSVLLSGLMVFNMLVAPTPVKAQDVGTYAYEDVPLYATVTFVMGDVDITIYTRYSSSTQKYTLLRYTYEDSFGWDTPLAKVTQVKLYKGTSNTVYSNGDVITDDIRISVTATDGAGTYWTKTVTKGVN